MSVEETNTVKDKLWTEIRQYVLDDGPAVAELDEMLAEVGEEAEAAREGLVATLIAQRCAQIASLSDGPMHNAPLAYIFNTWVAQEIVQAFGGERA